MGTTIRGLILQERALELTWTGTPVGPIPGAVAEADGQASPAAWAAGGEILGATSPALDLRVARAGLPGDAQILWREDGASNWYGWDALHVSHALRQLVDTGDTWRASSALRLADGTTLAAIARDDTAIEVWRSVDPGTLIEVYERSGGAIPAGELHAALVQLPSGRVLLLHWLVRSGSIQVRIWRSDDAGASWSLHQREALPSSLSTTTYTPYRLRAAVMGDGAILLIGHVLHSAPQDRLFQWASGDEGASFTLIREWDGVARGWPEIFVSGGRAVVVYLAYRAASAPNVLPYRRILSSAWESIADADSAAAVDVSGFEWGTYSGGEITAGELAGLDAGDGTLWIYGQNHDGTAAREIHAALSSDGGDAWTVAGSSSSGIAAGRVWAGGSATVYPADLVAAPWLGGGMLLHRWEGGADPDGLYGLEIGGYRVLSLPAADEGDGTIGDQTSWTRTWLPAAEPDALDAATWTQTTSGAPTVTTDGARLRVQSSGAGQAVSWSATPTTSTVRGLIAEMDCTPGTALPFLTLRVSGAVRYEVRAAWASGTWTLRDMIAGADLGTVDTTGSSATRHRLLLALDDGGALLQVSEVLENDAGADGAEIGRATGTPTSGASSSDAIQFGMLSGSSSGTECSFHGVAWAEGTDTGEQLATGQSVAERQGRPIGGAPVWISQGLTLAAVGGVAGAGETWAISARYRYDGSHTDPSVARSASVGGRWSAAPVLTWTWADGAARTPEGLPALYLERFNFRRATLEYRDAGGTWQSLGTLDLASASALGWSRAGSSIRAAATGSSSKRISAEALAGGWFGEAVPLGTDRLWKVEHNSGGRFNDGSTGGQIARLTVEGALAGDPTSGVYGFALPPRVLIVLPPSLLSAPFRAIRLSPSSNGAAASDPSSGEDYYGIGIALAGILSPFGRQYSHGRVSEVVSEGESVRGLSGALLAARRRGEARYAVEIAWSDAADEYPLSLPMIPATTMYGVNLATPAAALPDLQGTLERAGVDLPVVYVAALEIGSGTAPTVHHAERRELLYGVVQSEVFRLDTVIGDEGREARRGGTLRIEEAG